MMECKNISGIFRELHDGHTDTQTERTARQHFQNCLDCREEFKWYGLTVKAMNTLEEVAPPPDFMAQLNARLTRLESKPSFMENLKNLFFTTPAVPLPIGVAALSVLVVVGYVVYQQNPADLMPQLAGSQAVQSQVPTVKAGLAGEPRGLGLKRPEPMPAGTLVSTTAEPPTSEHLTPFTRRFPVSSHLLATPVEPVTPYPTVADRVGADHLTVESPQVEMAVESVKRILPNLNGRVVAENQQGRVGDKMLRVVIPPHSYGGLTSELINHGAVASGMDREMALPEPSKTDDNNVMLNIRFLDPR
jgi:hypothetical protein